MSLVPSVGGLAPWLAQIGLQDISPLQPLTGDAGFRQYYRFSSHRQSYLAVDAPPKYCNNQAFYQLALRLAEQQVRVPNILAFNEAKGFFCIEDFGDSLLADVLDAQSMDKWYQQAIAILPNLIAIKDDGSLPKFDAAFIQTELNIFTEWLCSNYLSLTLTTQEVQQLQSCFAVLVENALAQPQVFMHRDFHSRNLMVLKDNSLGVIDFQDAVIGPVTYDVVSLLRDCYVRWPQEKVEQLFRHFVQLVSAQLSIDASASTWQRWFDLMGIQRHVKASGIFARLKLRDDKPGYINDIPLTLSYIVDIARHYPELNFLAKFVSDKVIPALGRTLQ